MKVFHREQTGVPVYFNQIFFVKHSSIWSSLKKFFIQIRIIKRAGFIFSTVAQTSVEVYLSPAASVITEGQTPNAHMWRTHTHTHTLPAVTQI